MKYQKVVVFGLTASGKTTLAKKVSKILKTKIYHTDDFAYKKKWTIKSTKEEFMTKLQKTIKKNRWLVEGVHSEWVADAVKKADLVVFINPGKIIMARRAMRRSKGAKTDNLWAKLKLLYWIFRWGPSWYRKYKTSSKEFIELKTNKEIDEFLTKIK